MAVSMNFLKDFEKDVDKIEGVSGVSAPPAGWASFGNHVLNKVMSGMFGRGTPQGRITAVAGPSGAGKSFLVGNLIKNAQDAGYYILVCDSENALDNDYITKIGVDIDNNYNYKDVSSISHVNKIVSKFIKGYTAEYGTSAISDQPPVLIVIDSLDMLATDTELENFAKGDQKGDQGQRAKQHKAMLRNFVAGIKRLNIQIVVTHQVYRCTQDQILAGEGLWKVGDAIRYACSQILLVTKLKLKEDTQITGVRMKCEGFKTRFTKPFQTVTIEVPYDMGMDPNSGLIEAMEGAGIIKRSGSWYNIVGSEVKFQAKNVNDYVSLMLELAEAQENTFLSAGDGEEEDKDAGPSSKAKRNEKYATQVAPEADA
jgi:recombination protein RecA